MASALALVATTALTALVALPATAGAAETRATVTRGPSKGSFVYTAAPGQANNVNVEVWADGGMNLYMWYEIDDVVPIDDPGGLCHRPVPEDPTRITCDLSAPDPEHGFVAMSMKLGDGDDAITMNNHTGQDTFTAAIDLGTGKDSSTVSSNLHGSLENGGDVVYGGPGDDNISVHGNERAWGQEGNDTISADGEGSRVDGGAGNDLINAGAGRQILTGGTGNDLIHGGPGDDILYGNSGNDTLQGNSGNDKLYGGPGKDSLSGGPGRNVVRQD
ncbi:calcium-binding protein [Streptomyces graminilatus]|uniref:calcium-binding protein n=1 Tax=Streptomyces graminilatus TaxID=1464070 RepID=UPI0006E4142B|nr:calcium-binding protein [Streptomyces graminilatus]